MTIHDMQNLNRDTIAYIATVIRPGMTLCNVRTLCEEYMLKHGADSFWYWDVGAFVFRGEETILSVSGRQYQTADTVIEPNDIITIDLSPQCSNVWGDYSRTVIVEDGNVIEKEILPAVPIIYGLVKCINIHADFLPQTTYVSRVFLSILSQRTCRFKNRRSFVKHYPKIITKHQKIVLFDIRGNGWIGAFSPSIFPCWHSPGSLPLLPF